MPQGKLAAAALAAVGHVGILVNNAGGSRPLPVDAPDSDWDEAIALNFTSYRKVAHALLPQMIERRWGRIINITGKSEPEGTQCRVCGKGRGSCLGEGVVPRDRNPRHYGQLHSARPNHERADSPQLSGRLSEAICRRRDSGRLLGRTGGPRGTCRLPRLAEGTLHYRCGHSGRWRASPISVSAR